MSRNSELAKQIQEERKKELESTEKRQKEEILKIERTLIAALKQSESIIKKNFLGLEKRMIFLTLKSWSVWILSGMIVIAAMMGVMTTVVKYYERKLVVLHNQVEEEKEVMNFMKNNTWGLSFSETEQGRFIVLPEGIRAETTWKISAGEMESDAILLKKEK